MTFRALVLSQRQKFVFVCYHLCPAITSVTVCVCYIGNSWLGETWLGEYYHNIPRGGVICNIPHESVLTESPS